MSRRTLYSVLVLVAAGLGSGCAQPEPPAAPAAPADAAAAPSAATPPAATPPAAAAPAAAAPDAATKLTMHRWRFESATDAQGQSIADLVVAPGEPWALLFLDGRVAVEGTCNRMGGGYRLADASHLEFGQFMSTMMACPPPRDRIDGAVGKALAGTVGFAIEGDAATPRLRLTAADGSVLVFVGSDPAVAAPAG